jgi:hypothetical protein
MQSMVRFWSLNRLKPNRGVFKVYKLNPNLLSGLDPAGKSLTTFVLGLKKKNGRAFEIKLANPDWVYNTKNLSLAFTFQKFSIFFTGKYRTIDNVVKNIDKMVTFWPIVVKF